MSDGRPISFAKLAVWEARTFGPGGGRESPAALREEIENLLMGPEWPVSAAYLAADVLGVAEERVRALAAQGVLPCDAEGLFPIQAAVDAYVAHLSAVEEAGELGRFRAEEADRLAARQKGGQSAAVVGHHFRVKWSFMWPAFLRDREERGAGGKLRPAVLARVTLAEYRKHRKAAFGEDDPATPRKRTVEDWFRQWEKDFPEAQSEASQAIARLK